MFNGGNSNYAIIVDYRTEADFKKLTFLNHKKAQVFKQLEKCIYDKELESTAHWLAELICSGYLFELLDFFAIIYSKYVNVNNPIFPFFLTNAFSDCGKIANEKRYLQNPLEIRNNEKIRSIVCRIGICLAISIKSPPTLFSLVKIPNQDFSEADFRAKIVPTQNYLTQIIKEHDDKQIIVVGNQIVQSIIVKDISKVVYWMSWILQYEKLKLKENKSSFVCQPRIFEGVEAKFYVDITWFIWEIIINIPTHNENKKHIIALLKLYSNGFTKPKRATRIVLLLNAIMILISNPNYQIPLIRDAKLLNNATKNVNVLYEEIKIKLNSSRELPQSVQQQMVMQPQQQMVMQPQQQQQQQVQVKKTTEPKEKKKQSGKGKTSKEYEESMSKMDLVDELMIKNFYT
jgi:hypothetical protein